jgi:transcription antitermination factor NusG
MIEGAMMADKKEEIRWNWYLLQSEPGAMTMAKMEIVARGVEFLWPRTWRRASVDGKMKAVPSPRLPGSYAFVRLPCLPEDGRQEMLNEQAAAVKSLRGVRDLFKNAMGHYSPVPNWEIQALKDIDAQEEHEAAKSSPKTKEPKFPAGSMVRILRHATAAGHVGEYLYSVRGIATLAMGNGIKMSVPDCDLTMISKGEAARLAG